MARFRPLRTLQAALYAGLAALAINNARAQDPPRIDAITNAASYSEQLGEGSFASIFGSIPIKEDYCVVTTVPFPTSLCGVSVTADGERLPLHYIGKNQINFLLPNKLGLADLRVEYNGVPSSASTVTINDVAPGIFQRGPHFAAIVKNDGTVMEYNNPVGSDLPAESNDRIISLYFTGGGTLKEVIEPGAAAPTDHLVYAPTPTVKVDGQQLPATDVLFAGRAPGFVGLWQSNIRLPTLSFGAHTLEYCVNNKCDKADLLIAPKNAPVLVGNISDLNGKNARFAGTLSADGYSAPISTTELGTFAINDPKLPATLTIDQASDKYAALTTTVTAGPVFKQMIPWREFTQSMVKYTPQPFTEQQVEGYPDPVPVKMFPAGNQPLNNIMLHHFESLQRDGTTQTTILSAPAAIYNDGMLPEIIQEIQRCQNPWNSNGSTLTFWTNADPGAGHHRIAFRPSPNGGAWAGYTAARTPVGKNLVVTELNSVIYFPNEYGTLGPKMDYCTTWEHELGHLLWSLKHLGSDKLVMYYAPQSTKIDPVAAAGGKGLPVAPEFERTTAAERSSMNPNTMDISEHSWTASTTPTAGATYQPSKY